MLLVVFIFWLLIRFWLCRQSSKLPFGAPKQSVGVALIALVLFFASCVALVSKRLMLFSASGPLDDGSRLQALFDSYAFLLSDKWLMAFGFGFGTSGVAVVSGTPVYPVNLVDFVSVITFAQYGLAGLLIKVLLFFGMLVLLGNILKNRTDSNQPAVVYQKIIAETGILMIAAILLSFLVGEFALNRGFLAILGCVYAVACNLEKDKNSNEQA